MKKNKKVDIFKKHIKAYLTSEEGKMLDKDIMKTAIAMGLIGLSVPQSSNLEAAGPSIHTNYFTSTSHISHGSHGSHSSHGSHGSHGAHGSHGSHGAHGSHGSHGSHARGGWC